MQSFTLNIIVRLSPIQTETGHPNLTTSCSQLSLLICKISEHILFALQLSLKIVTLLALIRPTPVLDSVPHDVCGEMSTLLHAEHPHSRLYG